MSEYIIEAREIEYKYPDGTKALDNISFKAKKGEKLAFLGPNGAGKTTLFLHLNGILKPEKGEVIFAGRPISYRQKSLQELRSRVGIVFQDPDDQLFAANVFQEISFGPLNMGLSKKDAEIRVSRAMRQTGVEDLKNRPTHYLSQGQKKRVSIADILAMDPEVIIFDEPTASLDPKHKTQIVDLLDEINREGITVIMSTHDVDLAYSWADYIYVMVEGAILGEGIPGRIFSDEILLKEAGLNKPMLLEVFSMLQKKGIIENEIDLPADIKGLALLINSGSHTNKKGNGDD
ncbi:MAG: ATP-binding cassette domain-containing protein [Peptococcaceae bacterium]|nr:ATP-binding cassette domain-containing protein [Peptococcaceae bacterium]